MAMKGAPEGSRNAALLTEIAINASILLRKGTCQDFRLMGACFITLSHALCESGSLEIRLRSGGSPDKAIFTLTFLGLFFFPRAYIRIFTPDEAIIAATAAPA